MEWSLFRDHGKDLVYRLELYCKNYSINNHYDKFTDCEHKWRLLIWEEVEQLPDIYKLMRPELHHLFFIILYLCSTYSLINKSLMFGKGIYFAKQIISYYSLALWFVSPINMDSCISSSGFGKQCTEAIKVHELIFDTKSITAWVAALGEGLNTFILILSERDPQCQRWLMCLTHWCYYQLPPKLQ